MKNTRLLIANRGEIAIRIANAAFELGIESISIFSEDDVNSLHTRKSDETFPLTGRGAKAYLDKEQIISIAKKTNCQLIHPGYGFLSEDADFAEQCGAANLKFVGPNPEVLSLFGNKIKARQFAEKLNIPIIPGTTAATSLAAIQSFFQKLKEGEKIMIKALAGGGGRGMRLVQSANQIEEAFERCQAEALKAFGNDQVYVEKYIPIARHVEVQIIGDGSGAVSHLWERECSIQRQHQKLIEIAPCPNISEGLRQKIIAAAIHLAKASNYENAGTFEFLVEGIDLQEDANFYFLEANPRIQVEHTVTEEVTGIDLVKFQLEQALGKSLQALKLEQTHIPKPIGFAMQTRINMETLDAQGNAAPKTGKLNAFELPAGTGIRVDTFGYVGYQNNPNFDSLLAKLICHSGSADFQILVNKAYRALCQFKIEGIPTNLAFLQNILQHSSFSTHRIHTRFIEENLPQLLEKENSHQRFYFENENDFQQNTLAKQVVNIPEGCVVIESPMPGSVVNIEVAIGDPVIINQALLIIESMKMENVVQAVQHGIIKDILIKKGDVLFENQPLFLLEISEEINFENEDKTEIDLEKIRPELAELQQRKSFLWDENRPEAVAKRHKKGKRTARENIADLCDGDSFVEYGSLIVAAQRSRRKIDDLIKNTPADGVITGIGAINTDAFEEEKSKCLILSYDYMVLAGTQGMFGHQKTDRILDLAHRSKLPFILFAEGGGGRPGDTDYQGIGGLHIVTFAHFAKLSGIVPRICIVSGYCFAGNAALAGCSDIIIATKDTSIGMGGPAMIEGGGLGNYHPKEVGPVEVQAPNGVLDIIVKDEIEAVAVAKKCLSYFQGNLQNWTCDEQIKLRHLIPENRRRVYDIRTVIHTLADTGSVLELRPTFAAGMITAFVRIEGKALGLIANNPKHLGGAVDAEGSDKASRFLQLCNTFKIPILSLCDTPGFMVGPEAEKTATVRHTSRLFTIGAKVSVPYFTIVLRKAYGLGAMAMAAGGFHQPFFTISWPTGEFGGMGLEGAVRLGFKKELEKIEDPIEREQAFQKMVDGMYQHGKALNAATFLEIDEVIDPINTRKWIVNGLLAHSKSDWRENDTNGFVDSW